MPRYVALLRGVNVGGRNKLRMDELRSLVESLGYTEVSTFIQSGNVLFSAAEPASAASLRAALSTRLGIDAAVVLRSAAELARAVASNPFDEADPARLHVGFLTDPPASELVAKLDAGRYLPEEVSIIGNDVYLHLPDGMGRAKLPGTLDRKLGMAMTVRNWNTVTRLLGLLTA